MNIDLKQLDDYISEGKLEEALSQIIKFEETTEINFQLLIRKAEIYYLLQKFSNALNLYKQILKIEPENKLVQSKIEMITTILKYQACDIFESTNLNADPWLD